MKNMTDIKMLHDLRDGSRDGHQRRITGKEITSEIRHQKLEECKLRAGYRVQLRILEYI